MYTVFDTVKNAVTIPEVVRAYGYTANKSGFILCPFHIEKTPSMKLYERVFHCFGCGAHGSVIDFVSMVFGLSPFQAALKLNHEFNLHLSEDPSDFSEQKKKIDVLRAQRLFETWREETLNRFDAAIRIANMADYSDMSDEAILATHYREALEYWADILLHEPLTMQMEVFRDRWEVKRLCDRILKRTQTKSIPA